MRKLNKEKTYLWKIKDKDLNCFISSISVFELYAGAVTDKHKNDLKILFNWFEIISFSKKIAEKSGEIFRQLRLKNELIEFRDIFIGATAVELDIPLITLNESHFKKIEKIKIFDKKLFY